MKNKRASFHDLWKNGIHTAEKDLDVILGSATNLPMKYWRNNFFFKGMSNETWLNLTNEKFPIKADKKGSHPLFTMYMPDKYAGYVVCPCSSSSRNKRMWIQKGTKLLHTNYIMDKTSVILKHLCLTLPAKHAMQPRFMGEVAKKDIQRSKI